MHGSSGVHSLAIMAAFGHGKHSSKLKTKIMSAVCALWCIAFSGLIVASMKLKFPFDIIMDPLVGVEILASVLVFVHIVSSIILSATNRGGGASGVKPKNVVKCMSGILVVCVVFHIMAIFFGAPAVESSRETFHFAMLLTCLTALPACCVLGADADRWTTVFALGRPALGAESVIYITSISSVVGAWLGAVPIPLDWDRPWQVWPVSCVLGSLCGYNLGLLLSALYLPLKHRQLNKAKLT